MMQFTNLAIKLAEKGLVPDSAIRAGIRKLSETRLKEIRADSCEAGVQIESEFVAAMNNAPIALVPELANAQHYELPTKFFELCLGQHRKYSSCFWLPETSTLDEAEANALQMSCEHADLQDGQQF
jgi:cyclopropane-fatty-acyl-phospholipid synthase